MRRVFLLAAAMTAADAAEGAPRATAVFSGGCFWCLEEDFSRIGGVISVETGYSGGRRPDPAYAEVAAGRSDHVFAVRVIFDPVQVGYAKLLEAYWLQIDPTDAGGQFCERGRQYRAAIFAQTPQQAREAAAARQSLGARLERPLAVDLRSRSRFWPAEPEHQDYARRNPKRFEFFRRSCRMQQKPGAPWSPRSTPE